MHQLSNKTRSLIEEENARWPDYLVQVKEWDASLAPKNLSEVWRSRHFLVQVYRGEHFGIQARLSVSCTSIRDDGEWIDGIGWDVLQRLKRECGFGSFDAVEIFPSDKDIVNVANMRHLWVMKEQLPFKWGYREYQKVPMSGNDR